MVKKQEPISAKYSANLRCRANQKEGYVHIFI